eukprot:15337574-Ditylum_brightwellii.AAC.1
MAPQGLMPSNSAVTKSHGEVESIDLSCISYRLETKNNDRLQRSANLTLRATFAIVFVLLACCAPFGIEKLRYRLDLDISGLQGSQSDSSGSRTLAYK